MAMAYSLREMSGSAQRPPTPAAITPLPTSIPETIWWSSPVPISAERVRWLTTCPVHRFLTVATLMRTTATMAWRTARLVRADMLPALLPPSLPPLNPPPMAIVTTTAISLLTSVLCSQIWATCPTVMAQRLPARVHGISFCLPTTQHSAQL